METAPAGWFDRYSDAAKRSLDATFQEARRFQHDYLGTEHLLLGLLREDVGPASLVLGDLGVARARVRSDVEALLRPGVAVQDFRQLPFTPRAKTVLELTREQAGALGHIVIGPEHLLIGLIAEKQGIAGQVLLQHGVTLERARAAVIRRSG